MAQTLYTASERSNRAVHKNERAVPPNTMQLAYQLPADDEPLKAFTNYSFAAFESNETNANCLPGLTWDVC